MSDQVNSSAKAGEPGEKAPDPGVQRILTPLYYSARFLFWVFYKLYNRLSVHGHKNVPASGPMIVVSNHASNLDPPLVGVALPRKLYYLAKVELFHHPHFARMLRRVGSIPISRGQGDRSAIRKCLEVLDMGEPLLIFPEGTRSRTGQLKEPQTGAAMIIAQRPDTPILPMRIDGSFQALGGSMKFPRPAKIRVVIGKPFTVSEMKNLPPVKKQLYREVGIEIMKRIAAARP